MARHSLMALSALLVAACSASAPIYEFRPTQAPLRYEINDQGTLLIDTPVGEQRSTDSTEAVVTISIAAGDSESRQVKVIFESLDFWAGADDTPTQHVDGGDLVGQPFAGTLSQTGSIAIAAAPDIAAELLEVADPVTLFAELLPPLPPAGSASSEPWPHRTSYASEAAVSVQASYDGTASFAGDTTWNGRRARIILSEGITTTTGQGTPAGAPGEVVFTYTGRSRTRYIWDPDRGVMLASIAGIDAEGSLELTSMQMTMPISYEGSRQINLRQ